MDRMTATAASVQILALPAIVEDLAADERLKIETGDQRLDTNAVMTLAG